MRRLALLLACLGALACVRARLDRAGAATCAHVQAAHDVRGQALCEDVWTCGRPPGSRFDRVGLRRLALCDSAPGPVVLYLPGMYMNAELPITDPRYDLRLHLALAGVRAWGLDYRTHAVPPDATAADLTALAGWTADVFAGDAAWAVGFVHTNDPGPLHLVGFSYGAGLAYRLAARPVVPLAGLVVLDGASQAGRAAATAGPAIDVGGSRLPWAERRTLLAQVRADPHAPSPIPGFTTAGGALADIIWSAQSFGGHGGLSNARDGVTDVQVLADLLASYDRWWPSAALGSAAPPAPGTALPVLAFASTEMGPEWTERVRTSARAFGGEHADVRALPRHGHLDVLIGNDVARDVFEPVRTWLEGAGAHPAGAR